MQHDAHCENSSWRFYICVNINKLVIHFVTFPLLISSAPLQWFLWTPFIAKCHEVDKRTEGNTDWTFGHSDGRPSRTRGRNNPWGVWFDLACGWHHLPFSLRYFGSSFERYYHLENNHSLRKERKTLNDKVERSAASRHTIC
jgi:hypothetical protein